MLNIKIPQIFTLILKIPQIFTLIHILRTSGYSWLVSYFYAYSLASLNMKNFTSDTPLN